MIVQNLRGLQFRINRFDFLINLRNRPVQILPRRFQFVSDVFDFDMLYVCHLVLRVPQRR